MHEQEEQKEQSKNLAVLIVKKHNKMKGSRVNWDSHWQEIADFIIPNKDNVFESRTPGEKKGNRLFTGIGVHSNEKLASALHGMLTNPSAVWFGLSSGNKTLDKEKEVKLWLQESTQTMIDVLNQTNFQTEIHELYLDLGSFGTGVIQIEEDDESVVRFLAKPIYECYIKENFKGLVDTVSYEYKQTLREMAQEFGADNLGHELQRMLEADSEKEMTIVHMVEPRENFDPKRKAKTSKPIASYHVVLETSHMLKESGFDELPYIVPRWIKMSGEVYGRSPGMTALPDVKMVNAMTKAVIQGTQKIVDPMLQVPDDGMLLPIKSGPGDINYYRSGTKDRIEPVLTGSRPDLGLNVIAEFESRIKEAYFIDQLQIREADRMTATEIVQRREEQLRLLGPILGRQHFELLKPMVDRIFGIMVRKELFKPAPQGIQGKDLQVRYTSQIATVQETAATDNLTRVVGLIAPLVEAKPEVMDNFDEDAILRDLAAKFGLPAEYLEDEDTVSEIRTARAKAMQQQEQAQAQQQSIETVETAQDFAL